MILSFFVKKKYSMWKQILLFLSSFCMSLFAYSLAYHFYRTTQELKRSWRDTHIICIYKFIDLYLQVSS